MKKSEVKFSKYQILFMLILIIMMIIFEFIDMPLFQNLEDEGIITDSIMRLLGGIAFIIILTGFGYAKIFQIKHFWKSLFIIIPALIISINNFPIIAFFDGRALLSAPEYRIYLFLFECLCIGFYEEIIYRGIILGILFQNLAKTKNGLLKAIVFSSFVFGLSHLLNLFSGAAIGDTVLQIGYSFLLGTLWAVMYLKTQNLWLTMLLHATYNFFGQVMFRLGTVEGRFDIYTVIITVVLAVLVAIYTIGIFKQLKEREAITPKPI